MARDLDFSPRRRQVPNTLKTGVSTAPLDAKPPTEKPQSSRGWLWFLVIILVVAISIGLGYYYYQNSTATSNSIQEKSKNSLAIGSSTTDSNSAFGQTQDVTIQVYDSGAGPKTVDAIIANLKGLGYATENVNESQFHYDKTYVWYREGLSTEAEKIASVLTGREVGLKETKVAGSFDILILVGEK